MAFCGKFCLSTKYLFLLIVVGNLSADWTKTSVGSAPNVLNQLRVGDGRNDGVQRVYAVCEDGHVYEWTYGASNWVRTDMGEAPGTGWCLGIDIGVGRNDGLNRVYMTRINGHVYEYFCDSGGWTITDLGSPNATLYGVKVGPGQNDGVERVYACGDGVPLVEYTWTGNQWDKDTVEPGGLRQWLPDIGPGRNDGVDRLYVPNGMGPVRTVAEYSWTGSSFTRSDLPTCPGNPLAVSIGPGRNDGVNRLYVSTRQRCHEFTYASGNWTMVDILPSLGAEERYDICLGRTKSDGLFRAYITCSGTQFLETSWDGSTWVDTVVDAVSAATCGVHIGRGRNDDTVRVYGCNRNGEVYEFTHSDPYVSVGEYGTNPWSTLNTIRIRPNPFFDDVIIEYTLSQAGYVRLTIHNVAGEEVCAVADGLKGSGIHTVVWRSRDRLGRKLPAGVYVCRLETEKGRATEKMLVIR